MYSRTLLAYSAGSLCSSIDGTYTGSCMGGMGSQYIDTNILIAILPLLLLDKFQMRVIF